jgi:hypothetical protein
MAMVSLILGLASWFFVPLVGAVGAIVTGHLARSEIRNSYASQGGDGLAIAGLVLGYLNVAFSCIVPLLIIVGVIGLGSFCAFCAALSDPNSFGAVFQP